MNIKDYEKYAKPILRIGLAIVFLYFGISQLLDPEAWLVWLPSFAQNLPIEATTLILLNGISEVILGTLLLLGLLTRIVSFLLFIHILGITISVGLTPVGVRDFGLTIATLVIFLNGKDDYCLDNKFRK